MEFSEIEQKKLYLSYGEKEYACLYAGIIINECLNKKYPLNTSKLVKLLYYMQKQHLEKYNKLMFGDKIIATECGPNIDKVYEDFKYGSLGFRDQEDVYILLFDSHRDVIETVLEEYAYYSPSQMMEKSMDDEIYKMVWSSDNKNIDMNIILILDYLDKNNNKTSDKKEMLEEYKKLREEVVDITDKSLKYYKDRKDVESITKNNEIKEENKSTKNYQSSVKKEDSSKSRDIDEENARYLMLLSLTPPPVL